eukprot:TRINITY_DN4834_c0_g1_i3.p1 TRINITY_DN4834_c0_g1~~TRINITY_DN4834_c0_g1_i3.p1  ORF type:complete len:594 (+),score=138.88 TRINITY_DN4834_c0_g1_i3:36-1784(+)
MILARALRRNVATAISAAQAAKSIPSKYLGLPNTEELRQQVLEYGFRSTTVGLKAIYIPPTRRVTARPIVLRYENANLARQAVAGASTHLRQMVQPITTFEGLKLRVLYWCLASPLGAPIIFAGIGLTTLYSAILFTDIYVSSPTATSHHLQRMSHFYPCQPFPYVARGDLQQKLVEIVEGKAGNWFHVLVGPKGTGKTQSLRSVLGNRKNVVYLNITEDCGIEEFTRIFAAAVGCDPPLKKLMSRVIPTWAYRGADPLSLNDVWSHFVEYCKYVKKHEGEPVVLVIDHFSRLLSPSQVIGTQNKSRQDLVLDMIERMKGIVDERLCCVVVSLSDGPVVELLQSTSGWSRSKLHYVSGLSRDEALKFLAHSGMPFDLSEKVIDIVGTSPRRLNGPGEAWKNHQSETLVFEACEDIIESELADIFEKVLHTHETFQSVKSAKIEQNVLTHALLYELLQQQISPTHTHYKNDEGLVCVPRDIFTEKGNFPDFVIDILVSADLVAFDPTTFSLSLSSHAIFTALNSLQTRYPERWQRFEDCAKLKRQHIESLRRAELQKAVDDAAAVFQRFIFLTVFCFSFRNSK